jgi:hypothetical protein
MTLTLTETSRRRHSHWSRFVLFWLAGLGTGFVAGAIFGRFIW